MSSFVGLKSVVKVSLMGGNGEIITVMLPLPLTAATLNGACFHGRSFISYGLGSRLSIERLSWLSVVVHLSLAA